MAAAAGQAKKRWWVSCTMVLLALLAGCSLVSIAYNNADLWLLDEVGGYVPLGTGQKERLRVALRARLERHRAPELPRYVELLDEAHVAAADGLSEAEVESLMERVQALAGELVAGTAPQIAALLAELDDSQRAHLATRLRAADRSYREDFVLPPAAKRLTKRAKVATHQLRHWVGDLNPAQRARITELTQAWPDLAERWHGYRAARTQGLVDLVQLRGDAATLERFLVSRWVLHEDRPPDLERDVAVTRRGIVELIVALDGALSAAQRKTLLDRLRGYRDDLAALLPPTAPAIASARVPEPVASAP